MEIESKDPALGTITDSKIKVPVEPDDVMVKAKEKPHKGNPYKLAIWILSVVVVLLIAALVFLAFCPASPLKTCPENGEQSGDNSGANTECPACEATEEEDVATRKAIGILEDSLKSYVKAESDLGDGYIEDNVEKFYDMVFPDVKLDSGLMFPLNRSYAISFFVDGNNYADLYNKFMATDGSAQVAIKKSLTDNGFAEYEQLRGATEYINDAGVICLIADSGMPFTAACGHKSWYSADEAKLAEELAEAYNEKAEYDLHYIRVNADSIVNSQYEPYQRVVAMIDDAKAYFYRTNPEAEWQFFKATQAPIACSDYDTEDLKRAFMGETCYIDSSVGETVKP